MRHLALALAGFLTLVALLVAPPAADAAPPYTVTVEVTGDDAQGLFVRLAPGQPGQSAVDITIGADNKGSAVVNVGGFYEVFAPNGFTPAQQTINLTDDRLLEFAFTDPFGGGGGGGGGGGPILPVDDFLLVTKLKTKVNAKKAGKDKLLLKCELHTASGLAVAAPNDLTLDISPAYQQVIGAASLVAKGKSGRKFVFQDATTKLVLKLRKGFGNKPDKLTVKRKNLDLGTDVGPEGTRVVGVMIGSFDETDDE